jgi:plastocyanin
VTRFRVLGLAVLLALGAAAFAAATPAGRSGDDTESKRIAIRDDCDPRDPAWAPTGGCALDRGDVSFAEFVEETSSPLSLSVIGHQAWRNDPSYLKVKAGTNVRVKNVGGRAHTFTEVAAWGGGKIPFPPLNQGLTIAPECPGSIDIAPGDSIKLSGLAVGNHRFLCCIHPWMRAVIKVKAGGGKDDDD